MNARDELHERFERESSKLDRLRKDEESAYTKFCHARHERDYQEREVSHLFDRLFAQARANQ